MNTLELIDAFQAGLEAATSGDITRTIPAKPHFLKAACAADEFLRAPDIK